MTTEFACTYTVCETVTCNSYTCNTLAEAFMTAKRYAHYGFNALITVKTSRDTWNNNKIVYSIYNKKIIFVTPEDVTSHSAFTTFHRYGKMTNCYFKW